MPSANCTIHGHVHSFKSLLNTFLSELEEMEPTGLRPGAEGEEDCDVIRAALMNIVEHILKRDTSRLMSAYHGAIANLADAYKEWNGADKGRAGREARKKCLEAMRKAKHDLPQKQSWGPDHDLDAVELEFLIGLRVSFEPLRAIPRPEVHLPVKGWFRRRDQRFVQPTYNPKRLPNGQQMAFARTCGQI